LTAFTDGCPGLQRIWAGAGVTTPPMLDWFHVAMRLQHLKQIADGLSADDPARVAAKAVIVEGVERLRWRIWGGKARNAQISIDRICAVMHHLQGEPDRRRSSAPSRKLSNSVFDTYDTIVDRCCAAWNWLTGTPDRIRSVAAAPWTKTVKA